MYSRLEDWDNELNGWVARIEVANSNMCNIINTFKQTQAYKTCLRRPPTPKLDNVKNINVATCLIEYWKRRIQRYACRQNDWRFQTRPKFEIMKEDLEDHPI